MNRNFNDRKNMRINLVDVCRKKPRISSFCRENVKEKFKNIDKYLRWSQIHDVSIFFINI